MQTKTNPSPTSFGLLRHGKTEWNSVKRIQGSADSPLTQGGIENTLAWIPLLKKINWDRILASDLGRVRQSVELLNSGLKLSVTYDTRLREQCWGEWEGLTIPFIKENLREELEKRVAMGWNFSAPGGESRLQVKTRVFETLRQAAEKWPGQRILTICHQGVIKCTLYSIVDREFVPDEDPLIKLNSLHLISCQTGDFVVEKLNIAKQKQK